MKHLVLVTTSYPVDGSGIEAAGSFVADVASELSKAVNITVVAPGLDERIEKISEHLVVHFFKVPSLPLVQLSPFNFFTWKNIFVTLKSGQKALDEIINNQTVDHILAFWVMPSGYWARNAFKKYDVPFSSWALGSDIWKMGKIPFIRGLIRKILLDSQHRMADGVQLKEDVEILCKEKCLFMPSSRDFPISKNKLLSSSTPYRLAYLGRWHVNKGVDILLQSLSLLEDIDWKKIQEVRICGGGPLENLVQQLVNDLNEKGRPVKLSGYQDKSQAGKLFEWADYVFIPSRVESIPVVFSDAMKAMCPVISTPVGDMQTLLSQYNVGICSREVNAKAYADAICEALNTRPSDYISGMLDVSKVFSLETICKELHALLWAKKIRRV